MQDTYLLDQITKEISRISDNLESGFDRAITEKYDMEVIHEATISDAIDSLEVLKRKLSKILQEQA